MDRQRENSPCSSNDDSSSVVWVDWAHLRYRRHSLYDPGRWPRARSKVSAITDDEEIEDDPSRWSRYLIHVFRWYGPTRSSSDSHSRSDVVVAVDSDAMMVGGR